MKLTKILLCLTLVVFSAFAAKHFWRGPTLSESEVAKRWGVADLNVDKFKMGDEKVRASMAYSILKNQKSFRGKFVVDLRKELGSPDGFYFSDVFPAYMIQRGLEDRDEAWQIVFLLNNERKVENVIVHRIVATRQRLSKQFESSPVGRAIFFVYKIKQLMAFLPDNLVFILLKL